MRNFYKQINYSNKKEATIDENFYLVYLAPKKSNKGWNIKKDHTKRGTTSNWTLMLKSGRLSVHKKVEMSMFLIGFQVPVIVYGIKVILRVS